MCTVRNILMGPLVDVFVCQILKDNYDIRLPPYIEAMTMFLTQSVDKINAKNYSNPWSTVSGYPLFQLFLFEIIYLRCSIHKHWSLYCYSRPLSFKNIILPNVTILMMDNIILFAYALS